MKDFIVVDPWKIVEDKFDTHLNPNSESLFSIGNGRMGQRANFPEKYSGESLQGSYIAGVYYPDKTRVGWWKNGYPEYFAKVLNSVNWIGLQLIIDGEEVDLAKVKFTKFHRVLDMQKGLLQRSCSFTHKGKLIHIEMERFYSLAHKDYALMQYKVSADETIALEINSYLDFNVSNQDSNYDEYFWQDRDQGAEPNPWVKATTRKTEFVVSAAQHVEVNCADQSLTPSHNKVDLGVVSQRYEATLGAGQTCTVTKYVAICSSFYHDKADIENTACQSVQNAASMGYEALRTAQADSWAEHWANCDIEIHGDDKAQQGIRFNIFQLMQTYSGDDARLNIGPKGFTGEKYGGSTYWDTEAYCLPFYMSTAPQQVGRNLLIYRHNHLQKAIENAQKLGFTDGAALYPMVTMNGEECHNEWEITFEEIHRNGAIAYAIFDYIQYTGDERYLAEYGLEVLVGIARFWAQRFHMSPAHNKYVMMGVTGPNEYENNVDNNWYTSYIAKWSMEYARQSAIRVKEMDVERYEQLLAQLDLSTEEMDDWLAIASNIYFPVDEENGIFWQQDGYWNKEDITVDELDPSDRPLNQKWSWDRILRSPFIKQADVLQGIYFFEDDFDIETIRKNFEYYEPRTVHESSLSPCVHSILAAKLGMNEKAYEMYLRTARLDLDDYNNDTEDGLHITSMAGTWLSIVKGFAGMRAQNGALYFSPFIPPQWESYSFKIVHGGKRITITVSQNGTTFVNNSDKEVTIYLNGEKQILEPAEVDAAV